MCLLFARKRNKVTSGFCVVSLENFIITSTIKFGLEKEKNIGRPYVMQKMRIAKAILKAYTVIEVTNQSRTDTTQCSRWIEVMR
jgi:hypothetical protein